MTDRPMLFKGDMVCAILDGKKTMTRQLYKPPNGGVQWNLRDIPGMRQILRNCPYGQVGDRIWVRESWQAWAECDKIKADQLPVDARLRLNYPADGNTWPNRIRPSIHMPRWASRLTLEITDIKIERLQDISDNECKLEGVSITNYDGVIPVCHVDGHFHHTLLQGSFALLWESINGQDSWAANPWVWVICFKRVINEVKE